ncbi:hypothetical protein CYMTET_44927 [Cymbomonas tetramitiformis]|uniref:RNA demethylase ALKBH5 n=1 Tax=Cymbomonas tetramitiformis TaxID=36881 RepID=A0AAE0C0Z0_9CHLO|nr:hypothetical protein CYMTET_44927 [Cymbomonas tetramitiformis]
MNGKVDVDSLQQQLDMEEEREHLRRLQGCQAGTIWAMYDEFQLPRVYAFVVSRTDSSAETFEVYLKWLEPVPDLHRTFEAVGEEEKFTKEDMPGFSHQVPCTLVPQSGEEHVEEEEEKEEVEILCQILPRVNDIWCMRKVLEQARDTRLRHRAVPHTTTSDKSENLVVVKAVSFSGERWQYVVSRLRKTSELQQQQGGGVPAGEQGSSSSLQKFVTYGKEVQNVALEEFDFHVPVLPSAGSRPPSQTTPSLLEESFLVEEEAITPAAHPVSDFQPAPVTPHISVDHCMQDTLGVLDANAEPSEDSEEENRIGYGKRARGNRKASSALPQRKRARVWKKRQWGDDPLCVQCGLRDHHEKDWLLNCRQCRKSWHAACVLGGYPDSHDFLGKWICGACSGDDHSSAISAAEATDDGAHIVAIQDVRLNAQGETEALVEYVCTAHEEPRTPRKADFFSSSAFHDLIKGRQSNAGLVYKEEDLPAADEGLIKYPTVQYAFAGKKAKLPHRAPIPSTPAGTEACTEANASLPASAVPPTPGVPVQAGAQSNAAGIDSNNAAQDGEVGGIEPRMNASIGAADLDTVVEEGVTNGRDEPPSQRKGGDGTPRTKNAGRDSGLGAPAASQHLRTKLFFGHRYYDYDTANAEHTVPKLAADVEPKPAFVHAIEQAVRHAAEGAQRLLPTKATDMAVMNVYHQHGVSLSTHRDAPELFLRPVISLRLFSSSVLSFGCKGQGLHSRLHAIPLERGTVTIMEGYAADMLMHGIRGKDIKTDYRGEDTELVVTPAHHLG